MNPPELKYSKEHEWLRLESEGTGVIGITGFAVDNLGDVVFVELPEAGEELTQFEKMGEIESVKAVSDLYTPVSGRVLERNVNLIEKPELVNQGPHESGWMLKVAIRDASEQDVLLTADQYEGFVASQEQ